MPELTVIKQSLSSAADSDFFPYQCDQCGAPVCDRMQLMALALGYEEDLLCLPCLSQAEDLPLEALLPQVIRYIHSRDCFKNPWHKTDVSTCPLKPLNACPCKDKVSSS